VSIFEKVTVIRVNDCANTEQRLITNVLNSASENALSSLTFGRLNEGITPNRHSGLSIGAAFMGPPLSE
jgi:hypothetical protein